MGRPGPNPKPGASRRNASTYSWTEVPDRPYDGIPPVRPPSRRNVVVGEKLKQVSLTKSARDWWRVISTMPHCRLWSPSDWLFAAETAMIVDDFYRGDTRLGPEMRQRERAMGTTVDARMAMRIRYVSPEAEKDKAAEEQPAARPTPAGTVTALSDRRRNLTE